MIKSSFINSNRFFILLIIFVSVKTISWTSPVVFKSKSNTIIVPGDSSKSDTSKFKVNPQWFKKYKNPISLKDPSNLKTSFEFDTASNKGYIKKTQLGNTKIKANEELSIDEYRKQQEDKANKEYFKKRSQAQNFVKSGGGFLDKFKLDTNDLFKKILGKVEIKPSGSAELTFGGNFNTVRNPQFTARQQKNGQFVFNQKIQLNVTGSIGDQFKINTNYNTDAIFDFENLMKVNWQGKPDQIVKSVEVGNVSMPLNGTLIQGGMNLFGAKVKLQFGKLTTTVLFSQQKGKSQEVELQGGAQVTPFDIQCDQYDPNRHYFLTQYFRDNYETWLSRPPLVQSPIQITRIEVWVTNRTGAFENARDVIGFMDLGENKDAYIYRKNVVSATNTFPSPANEANTLFGKLQNNSNLRSTFSCIKELENNFQFTGAKQIEDYQLVNYARQLNASEYSLNSRLGYISLNQALNNDEVLAVAFEYTINGQVFQVGEFARDQPANIQNPNVLFLKLLKTVSIRPDLPSWKLMMKNIYSIGSYQMQSTNFKLQVVYADDPSNADLPYIPAENEPNVGKKNLVQVLNLDRINTQNELQPDGQFDWLEGITVNAQQGRIILPMLEPFGDFLRSKFKEPNGTNADYYAFDALYDSTRWAAQQQALKNKFFLRGSFQGTATNEISLNAFNIPKGSVRVTYNGTPLKEGEDYQVDYSIGRVKILNTGILNSGGTIKASFENNTALSIQQKTLYGTRLDYKINNDFLIGSTLLHLRERPLIPKVGLGDEPLSNTVIGFDGTYKTESRWLTKMIDRLPFLATKEMSNLMVTGEFAKIIPGVSPAIKRSLDPTGVSYLDDFEASETPYDLRVPQQSWFLASTPQGDIIQNNIFKGGDKKNELEFRNYVGKLSWYTLDPLFYRGDNLTPTHIKNDVDQLSNHYVREVRANEVYPNKQIQQGYPQTLPTFDLSYFPNQRGPYNFRVNDLNADGTFKDPQNNWAGIMRKIDNNDFEQANIDYIEIWLMDPFIKGHSNNINNKGQLYLHLGNVSEDVLKDSRKSFENGLPFDKGNIVNVDTTNWGRVPSLPTINTNFNNDPNARYTQDVGYDGFNDIEERLFRKKNYLDTLEKLFGNNSTAFQNANNDPSSDNYHYYRGRDYDSAKVNIIQRQKFLNGPDGNSPSPNAAPVHQPQESYPVGITMQPNDEDINRDFTLNEVEEYYQYRIDIDKGRLRVGENYVTDSVTSSVSLKNGNKEDVTWYQFKIPIRSYEKKVGQIPDFKSIRFIRLAASGFSDSIIMRFGALQLVRADWRKYLFSLATPGDVNPIDPVDNTSYIVSTVNIEKNGRRQPIPYVLPPKIFRTIDPTTPNPVQQNEQSLSLAVCGLKDGDARAAFKNTKFDIRNYNKFKLFIHAEAFRNEVLNDGDLSAFVRMGTDFTNNYYEIEIPLKLTNPGSTNENDIWPAANELDIDIQEFVQLKLDRIRVNAGNSVFYEKILPDGKRISVIGIPDMSNLRVMMLGIRNPKKTDAASSDDGLSKCGEVWFNEMRVSGFDNPGGWAATGRMTSKLADLGNFNMSGSITTVGYGGIDKKLNERARNNTMIFDVNTNLELGKFFPQKSGVSIPFFYGYTQTILRPHFYPLNPDVPMDSILAVSSAADGNLAKQSADDFTSRRSWNLTNVRKNKTGTKKTMPWDLPNFNFTYAFNEYNKRNQNIAYNKIKTYQFVVNWVYQLPVKKGIEPFKWVGKSKWLQLIHDFNFMPIPQSYSIITQTDRRYAELQNRANDDVAAQKFIDTLYDKNFTNKRIYDIKWDLTKALKITYNAIVQARIDEPIGVIYTRSGEGHDSILKNIKNGGRITDYNQQTNISYTVPFNKFPLTNWITTGVNYGVNYAWKTAPPALGDTVGNSISNSQNVSLNGQFNFIQLYSKLKILDEINKGTWLKKPKATAKPNGNNRPNKKTFEKNPKKGDEKEEAIDGGEEEKVEEPKPSFGKKILNHSIRFLLMAKNVTFTYSETNATNLPGFKPKPKYLGQDFDLSAPGLDFIFGSQDTKVKNRAAENGWLTNSSNMFNQYMSASTKNFRANATLEPFPDFRIQMNWDRSYSNSFTSFFKYDDTTHTFRDFTPMQTGSFSTTYFAWPTAFKKSDTASSEVFNTMEANRIVIAKELQRQDDRSRGLGNDTNNYPLGYGPLQQDVLVNSFIAAYSGKDVNKYKSDLFPKMPAPNWRITWNGLTKIKKIGEIFSNISISHGYTSKYTVGAYSSSLKYNQSVSAVKGSPLEPQIIMQSITISEQFSPLIGIDIATKKNFTTKFEYKKDRTMNLLTGNAQLTEQKNSEFVFGVGYRKKGFKIPFIVVQGGRRLVLENEITFRFDFSIRDQWTTIRKFDIANGSIPTAGSKIMKIKPEINYNINDHMTLRIFYDRTVTKPYTSNSFPTAITQFGITIRYTLQ